MSEWVDFKTIKHSTPISRILDHYRISLKPSGSNTFRGSCPLPTHSSSSVEFTFMVDTNKNVWSCHSQSCTRARNGAIGGNILDLVSLMEGCSLRSSALLIQSWFGQPSQTALPATNVHAKPAAQQASNTPLSFRLRDVDCAHAYLKDRGVSRETAQLFGIGLYTGPGMLSGRIVIPIHNEAGSIVAYAGRSIDDVRPRYRFPTGFHKGLELFNLHRYTTSGYGGRIVVVEGFFDAIKVFQAGFPAVALMGSTMSRPQADLAAQHFSEVVLLLDGDDAGRSGTRKAIETLRSRAEVKVGWIPDGNQPDELEPDEIKGLIQCSC